MTEQTTDQQTGQQTDQQTDAGRHPYVQLLDRIIAAAEKGDATDLFDIYAEGAVVWHNTDDREATVSQNAKLLEAMPRWVKDRRYTERRFHVFDGGVVQQHVLRGTRISTGEEVSMHACVVVQVDGEGRITRLDEYLDSAETAQFRP